MIDRAPPPIEVQFQHSVATAARSDCLHSSAWPRYYRGQTPNVSLQKFFDFVVNLIIAETIAP
jgi:hypothetical protein